MDHFFILDCAGRIVGNPRGYRTIRGAIRESERPGSPAHKAIWTAFYEAEHINPNHKAICKIVQYKPQEQTARGIFGYRFQSIKNQNWSI